MLVVEFSILDSSFKDVRCELKDYSIINYSSFFCHCNHLSTTI